MNALITGAGGFCGRHLTIYLEDLGVQVYTLSNRGNTTTHHYQINEITDIASIASVLKIIKPDYVFHLAGISISDDPILFYKVNTQYAVALLRALEVAGLGDCPVLLVGTSAEYGMVSQEQLPIREELSPHPDNHYGISKLAQTFAGLAASRNGRPIVIVRPFNIIGPGMPGYLVVQSFTRQIMNILNDRTPPIIKVGNLKSMRDFIDIRDVVKIYWQLIKTPSAYGEIINVCSGKGIAIGDILSRLIEICGCSIEVETDPSRFKLNDIPVHYGSIEKLQKILGFVPVLNIDATSKFIMEESKRHLRVFGYSSEHIALNE